MNQIPVGGPPHYRWIGRTAAVVCAALVGSLAFLTPGRHVEAVLASGVQRIQAAPVPDVRPAEPDPELSVTLSPTRGTPNSTVTVQGSGYDDCPDYGDNRVDVLWDGRGTDTSVPIDDDGRWSATITVPSWAAIGEHLIYGRCVDGGEWASARFDVGSAPPPPLALIVTLSVANGTAGSAITVRGSGYDDCPDYGNRRVAVLWDGHGTGTSVPIGDDGRWSATITVPSSANTGEHLVYGQCVDGGEYATARFSVSLTPTGGPSPGATAPGGPATVPPTGGQTGAGVPPGATANVPPGPIGAPLPSVAAPPGAPVGGQTAPTTDGTAAPAPGGTASTGGWPRPPIIAAIPDLDELSHSPWTLAATLLAIAVIAWLLIGWPAEMFNKTYEENESTIRRWLGLREIPKPPAATSWPVVLLFSTIAAITLTIGQPYPGVDRTTGVTALGFLIAIPLVIISYEFAIESHLRAGPGGGVARLRIVLPALGVTLGCVAISRLLDFTPGYVYGLVLAYTLIGDRRRDERREAVGVLRGAAILFIIAVSSWLLRQFGTAAVAASDDTPFALRLLDTTLGIILITSIETLVIGLIPLRFLHGRVLWRWHWWAWLAVYVPAAAVFVLYLLGPMVMHGTLASALRALWLFIAFCLGSLAFLGFFAWYTRRAPTHEPSSPTPSSDPAPSS